MNRTLSQNRSALTRADFAPLLAILLLGFILYLPMFLGRPVMPDTWKRFEPWNSELGYSGPLDPDIKNANNDAILLYTPWNAFTHRELHAGRIPAWDPYCLLGVPLASNHLVPVFYPVYALIAWFISPLFIMGASGLFHTLILGIFFYLFLREFLESTQNENPANDRIIRFGAWFASLFLMVSMIPNPHYQPWPMTLAFFPGIWFFHERWLKHRSPWAGLWMSLCWAVPLLAGYPSLIIQLSLFTAIWILLIRPLISDKPGPSFPARLSILIWPLLFALALSAIQNIPTILAASQSDRSVLKSLAELRHEASFTVPANVPWQIHVKHLTETFIPWRFPGNDFNNRGYLGLIPSAFALYALTVISKRKYLRVLGLTLILLAPFALIPAVNFAVYWLFRGVTIDPNPPIEVFGFLAAILCACGVVELSRTDTDKLRRAWMGMIPPLILLAIFLAAAATHSQGMILSNYWVIGPIVAVLIMVWLISPTLRSRFFSAAIILTAVTLVADALFMASINAPPLHDSKYSGLPMPQTESITALKDLLDPSKGGQWGRIVRTSDSPVDVMSMYNQTWLFYPNLGTYFEIPDAFGYFNLAPTNRMEFFRSIEPDSVIERRGIVNLSAWTTNDVRLFDIGARYFLEHETLKNDSSPPASKMRTQCKNGLSTFKSPASLARLPGHFGLTNNLMVSSEIRPRVTLVHVYELGWLYPSSMEFSAETVIDVPGRVVVKLNSGEPGRGDYPENYVVLNEGWAEGWHTWVNGRKEKVQYAGGILMAAELSPGENTVEFRYEMPGLKVGGFLSAFSILVWLLAGAWITRRSKKTATHQ